jgi:molecular chaperone Hsp33
VQGLVAERGEAEVGCDFCGAVYRFDPVDVGSLFTAGRETPPTPGGVH